MRWTSLGHACWLIEAAGLRLLCDPLVEVEHYGGVFEVCPRRRLHVDALAADFILVSHNHPDHFDVPSLAALAARDRESVVVTPDELVAAAARELGFSTVHLLAQGQRVELDGLRLVTTSSTLEHEWGLMVGTADGVVWNMVDSVLPSADAARAERERGLAALGHTRLDLALVQGQPMLEVQAQLGRATAFPYAAYARTLDIVTAIDAEVVVAASASSVHTAPFAWVDGFLHPVDEARFVADFARLRPDARVFASELGARYSLRAGEVSREGADAWSSAALIERLGDDRPRAHRPTTIPPVRDPTTDEPDDASKATVAGWIAETLGPALVAAYPEFGVDRRLRFVVEVVYPRSTVAWTLDVDAAGVSVTPGFAADWDALDILAGSMFIALIAGRRHWGELLLGGALRGYLRAYALGERGVERANLAPLFLYYALSYDDANERAVRSALARARGPR